jgi:hypothetical protein
MYTVAKIRVKTTILIYTTISTPNQATRAKRLSLMPKQVYIIHLVFVKTVVKYGIDYRHYVQIYTPLISFYHSPAQPVDLGSYE